MLSELGPELTTSFISQQMGFEALLSILQNGGLNIGEAEKQEENRIIAAVKIVGVDEL